MTRHPIILLLLAAATVAVTAVAPARAAGPSCGDHGGTRAAIERMARVHHLTGAAVRIDDPRCGAWTAASGVADRTTGRPMRADQRVRVASLTKSFTAAALLSLAAEHRVSLDAPVERYLPGLLDRNGHDGREITVRSLLRHTSGLPDHMDTFRSTEEFRFRHFEPEELVARALALPRPAPGWHYSTTNYVIAGLIVEKAGGRTLEAEVQRRISEPLRLRDTYWPGDETWIRGPHPRGYVRAEDGSYTDHTAFNVSVAWAGGALISSPRDVNAFYGALLGGRLLPPALLAEMRRTVPADPDRVWDGASYGLGLIRTPLRCGGAWWGHAGDIDGFTSLAAVGPSGRRVTVVFNENPATKAAWDDELNIPQTALCEDER
ncbi:serine hydrolase domain-containing protein [Actinomadura chokoriensis]|uniref:Serine hydrolase domain-containing protein n=1 Tax=Actinomadura chokoriensis TaxID=454156 RepID=A0ABV4R2U2_9ACTN